MPADHPLRTIRPIVDEVLATMGRRLANLYSREGRAVDPTGAIDSGADIAGSLRRAFRTHADGFPYAEYRG